MQQNDKFIVLHVKAMQRTINWNKVKLNLGDRERLTKKQLDICFKDCGKLNHDFMISHVVG